MTLREKLDALDAACKAATPTPWRCGVDSLSCSQCDSDAGFGASVVGETATDVCFTYALPTENAKAIVSAVNLAPPLSAIARAAMAYREALIAWKESDIFTHAAKETAMYDTEAALFAALDAAEGTT